MTMWPQRGGDFVKKQLALMSLTECYFYFSVSITQLIEKRKQFLKLLNK